MFSSSKDNEPLAGAVADLLNGGAHAGSINDLLVAFDQQWHRMARQILTRNGADMDLLEESVQAVRMRAWELLDDPPDNLRPDGYGGLVVHRATQDVIKLLRAHSSPLSKTDKIAERRSAVARTRATLVMQLGYSPTDDELIEAHNQALLERNPRAGRQGSLARKEDLSEHAAGSVVSVDSVAAQTGSSQNEVYDSFCPATGSFEDDTVGKIDLDAVITAVLQAADQAQRPVMAACMDVCMDTGAMPSAASLARTCGVSPRAASAALVALQSLLLDQLDSAAGD